MRTDTVHGLEGSPDWAESFHFGFYDRRSELCMVMRACLRLDRKIKEMSCHLMMPDGSTVGLNDEVASDDAAVEAKGLRLDEVEPGTRWRMSFRGGMVRTTERTARKSHVEFDLEFAGLNSPSGPVRGARTEPGASSDAAGQEHLEQFGKVTGSVSTGLDEFEVGALGGRSYSRGVMDWSTVKSLTRLTCQFSDERAISLARRVDERGTVDTGFVFAAGENSAVAQLALGVSSDADKAPRLFEATLVDAAGGNHKVLGTVMRRVAIPLKDREGRNVATMHESLCRYNLSGSIGHGVAEHMVRQL